MTQDRDWDAKRRLVLHLNAEGHSGREIAQTLCLHPQTVAKWLKEEGRECSRPPTRSPDPRRLQVFALNAEGHSCAEIARRVGADRKTVFKWLDEAGRARTTYRDVSPEEVHEIARRTVVNEESCREIARAMGRSVTVVARAREKAGVAGVARLSPMSVEERVREIRRLRGQGLSLAAIGEYVGLPASGVQYHCLKHGIEKGGAR